MRSSHLLFTLTAIQLKMVVTGSHPHVVTTCIACGWTVSYHMWMGQSSSDIHVERQIQAADSLSTSMKITYDINVCIDTCRHKEYLQDKELTEHVYTKMPNITMNTSPRQMRHTTHTSLSHHTSPSHQTHHPHTKHITLTSFHTTSCY